MLIVLHHTYRWFSPDITAAMLVHKTIEKRVFWELDFIIMQNMSHKFVLFCTPTWPSHHVIENHLYKYLYYNNNNNNNNNNNSDTGISCFHTLMSDFFYYYVPYTKAAA